jgi:putative oxidoreductase
MNLVQKLEMTADRQHSVVLDLLRIVLGAVILGKGIYFIQDTDAILVMLHNSKVEFISFMLAHYVAMAHLVGGVLIILGLLTRLAVLFQIPILLGAIIFVNSSSGFFSMGSELWFSVFVFLLLVYFLFYGSGPLSLDQYMKRHRGV